MDKDDMTTTTFDMLPEIIGEVGVSAGALHLSRWLLDNATLVQGMRVMELGCGRAVPTIAAKKAGASVAIGIDTNPGALAAARRLSELNDVSCVFAASAPVGGVDWVIGACLFDWAPALMERFEDRATLGAQTLYVMHAGLKRPSDRWRRLASKWHTSQQGTLGEIEFWEVGS